MAPAVVEITANPPAPAGHPPCVVPVTSPGGNRGGDTGDRAGMLQRFPSPRRGCALHTRGDTCHLISPMTLPTSTEKLMPPNRTLPSDKQKT